MGRAKKLYIYNDKIWNMQELAAAFNVSYSLLKNRLKRGLSIADAINTPRQKQEIKVEFNGKIQTLTAWANVLNIPEKILYSRIKISNMSINDAFTLPVKTCNKIPDAVKANNYREYKAYKSMKARCLNKNTIDYKDYMGRNIEICLAWLSSFQNFYNDLGYCAPGLTLERIDVNGNYCPGNCKWDTAKNQARNRRTNKLITYNGETKCLVVWCALLGINSATLSYRLNKAKWSIEKAFTTPIRKRRKK